MLINHTTIATFLGICCRPLQIPISRGIEYATTKIIYRNSMNSLLLYMDPFVILNMNMPIAINDRIYNISI